MIKPKIVISSCIEHCNCRYDKTYIANKYVKKMKDFVDFIQVCPEMEIGLGTPREAIRLIKRDGEDKILLVGSQTGKDVTDIMDKFTSNFIENLDADEIDGFILKSKSPTCAVAQAKMYKNIGKAHTIPGKFKGKFGGRIKEFYLDHPVEHDMRLTNDQLRDHFLINVFARAKFKKISKIKELVKFHSEYKYLMMVYNQSSLKKLGNIVANHNHNIFEEVKKQYFSEMINTFKRLPNTMRYVNTLLHIYGYFKNDINNKEKSFFLDALNKYQEDKLPLVVILNLLKSWVVRFDNNYLMNQTIFEPYPIELMEV